MIKNDPLMKVGKQEGVMPLTSNFYDLKTNRKKMNNEYSSACSTTRNQGSVNQKLGL